MPDHPLRSTRACLTLAVPLIAPLATSTPALGQLAFQSRIFATTQPGRPTSIPTGEPMESAARFDDHRALITTPTRYYLCDGATLDHVMPAGSQIPGQAAGVVWSSRVCTNTNISPINGRGAEFLVFAEGPGVGGSPRDVRVIGDPAGPVSLTLGDGSPPPTTTRTGLHAYFATDGLAVGPVEAAHTTIIPFTYRPRGFLGSLSSGGDSRLNAQGDVAGRFIGVYNDLRDVPVIVASRAGTLRTVATARTQLRSDRGAFALTNDLGLASCPLPDGSVFVKGGYTLDGQPRDLLWRNDRGGDNIIIAATGDHAPGAEPGVAFAALNAIGANPTGSFLFTATLAGPGVTPQNNFAFFLSRAGRITLVARSSPGAQLAFYGQIPATLTADDTVGIITIDRALLYTPRTGTVTVAQRGRTLAPSIGIHGAVSRLFNFYGIIQAVSLAGAEEANIPYVSADGELFLCLETGQGGFVTGVRINRPNCASDFNNDGFTDFFDYDAFVTCFEGGACPEGKSPDFNTDDFIDFFDYSDFVDAFERGC